MSSKAAAPRARKTFSRLKHVLELPNLIDIQKASFKWFLEEGLRETIDDISPIEDYTGTLAIEFGEYEFGDPPVSIQECREKDLTYQAPLSMTVRFVNKETGEIREQRVFMGDFPMMTEFGTFIINGTERVIVTQLVRSPGAYLMEPKDATKQVFTANLKGQVLLAALLHGELRVAELVLAELHRERAGVVLDWRYVVDRLPKTFVHEPPKGGLLDVDQVGEVENVLEARKTLARARRDNPSIQVEPPLKTAWEMRGELRAVCYGRNRPAYRNRTSLRKGRAALGAVNGTVAAGVEAAHWTFSRKVGQSSRR